MKVSDYLDSIEGTEKEPVFLKGLDEMTKNEDIAKALNTPIAGKLLTALVALGDSESIEAFKQTEHYEIIKEWGITVFDLEKGYISIHPGPKHLKRILAVAAVAGAGLLLLKLYKKHKLMLKA